MIITEQHWSTSLDFPLLAVMQLLPLIAAAALLILREGRHRFTIAYLVTGAELLLAILLFMKFDHTTSTMQFAEQLPLFGPLLYHVAVDGISVLFILLTALLSLMVVVYGRVIPIEQTSRFLAAALGAESTLMAMFMTTDMLWFVLVSIFELAIVGYLLWRWATSLERNIALARYLQFMGTSATLLLAGVLMLGWNYADVTGVWSFDLPRLLEVPIAASIQSVLFFLLFYGLAIRTPLFPLHGWLPVAAEHGTVAVAPVFLLGLKIGVYGMLRFVFPLLPDEVLYWQPFVVAFAVAGIFYAATLALMQTNLRRLLAFAVVSHTSVLVIGLFSLNHTAFQGSTMLSANFGLASAGLIMMTGIVFWRSRTMQLDRLGGLFDHLPFIAIAFLIAGLSIVGMPGTPGFDAAHLMLEAAIGRFGALVTVAAAVGNVVAAGFLLWSFQRAFLAPKPESMTREIAPASTLELILASTIITVLLTSGFHSDPWLQLIEHSFDGLNTLYGAAAH